MKNKEIAKKITDTVKEIHVEVGNLNENEAEALDKNSGAIDDDFFEQLLETFTINKDTFNREEFAGMSFDITNLLISKVQNGLEYENTKAYELSMLLDEDFTKQLVQPVNSLIQYHLNNKQDDNLMALMTAYKCLDLEDEVKKLTLTGEQYETWLKTDLLHINTEQFEILYSMSLRRQAELRSFRRDPLPSFQIDGKGKHYYNKLEVDKWLSNYKRQK